MNFIVIFFIVFLFSIDLFANDDWKLQPSPFQDYATKMKIIKELEPFLKRGNKIFGLSDSFILHSDNPKNILNLNIDPYLGITNSFSEIQILLNDPKFFIEVFDSTYTKADELNGFDWIGFFKIYTDAIKIDYQYNNYGETNYVYNNSVCFLSRLGEGYENYAVEHIRFWSLGKTIQDPCVIFAKKNKWIDHYEDYSLYSVIISKYKGVIGSHTVINIIIEKCEKDPTLEDCKLINFSQ